MVAFSGGSIQCQVDGCAPVGNQGPNARLTAHRRVQVLLVEVICARGVVQDVDVAKLIRVVADIPIEGWIVGSPGCAGGQFSDVGLVAIDLHIEVVLEANRDGLIDGERLRSGLSRERAGRVARFIIINIAGRIGRRGPRR